MSLNGTTFNIEIWLLSSNVKDIGVLYLIFALSMGVLFLGLIVQYIADNPFYEEYSLLLIIPIVTSKNFNIFIFIEQLELFLVWRLL